MTRGYVFSAFNQRRNNSFRGIRVRVPGSELPEASGAGCRTTCSDEHHVTGIPAEIRDRLFQPFFTTKPPGEGTGRGRRLAHSPRWCFVNACRGASLISRPAPRSLTARFSA
jgi:hypothetical protein